jgi:hypothetical protein
MHVSRSQQELPRTSGRRRRYGRGFLGQIPEQCRDSSRTVCPYLRQIPLRCAQECSRTTPTVVCVDRNPCNAAAQRGWEKLHRSPRAPSEKYANPPVFRHSTEKTGTSRAVLGGPRLLEATLMTPPDFVDPQTPPTLNSTLQDSTTLRLRDSKTPCAHSSTRKRLRNQ